MYYFKKNHFLSILLIKKLLPSPFTGSNETVICIANHTPPSLHAGAPINHWALSNVT